MNDYQKYMTEDDIRRVETAKVCWHDTMRCKHCDGKMFWDFGLGHWICQSWLYMEGGCYWGDE